MELTATEYELLRVLAQERRPGPDPRGPCCAGSGPDAPTPKPTPKIVRAYVKRLRDKLGDEAARPALIVNERGVGYRMPRPGDR